MIELPESELQFSFSRSSGPGGQNVNKVNSKAELRWNIRDSSFLRPDAKARFLERYAARILDSGEVRITSDRHRDQGRNRADCIEKLREMISAILHPPKKRKKTKPTRSAERRRRESKKRHSEKKAARNQRY